VFSATVITLSSAILYSLAKNEIKLFPNLRAAVEILLGCATVAAVLIQWLHMYGYMKLARSQNELVNDATSQAQKYWEQSNKRFTYFDLIIHASCWSLIFALIVLTVGILVGPPPEPPKPPAPMIQE
jgi:hypothetical protein